MSTKKKIAFGVMLVAGALAGSALFYVKHAQKKIAAEQVAELMKDLGQED